MLQLPLAGGRPRSPLRASHLPLPEVEAAVGPYFLFFIFFEQRSPRETLAWQLREKDGETRGLRRGQGDGADGSLWVATMKRTSGVRKEVRVRGHTELHQAVAVPPHSPSRSPERLVGVCTLVPGACWPSLALSSPCTQWATCPAPGPLLQGGCGDLGRKTPASTGCSSPPCPPLDLRRALRARLHMRPKLPGLALCLQPVPPNSPPSLSSRTHSPGHSSPGRLYFKPRS